MHSQHAKKSQINFKNWSKLSNLVLNLEAFTSIDGSQKSLSYLIININDTVQEIDCL